MTTRSATKIALNEAVIVRTAGEFIDEFGPESLSLTRVADRLGVTQPAMYRHVDSLSDLWRSLGLWTRARLADELESAAAGLSRREALAAVAHAWRTFGQRHPGRYVAAGRYAVAGDATLEAAARRTRSVLENALSGFGLSHDELRFAGETTRSALHGFLTYELGDGNPDPDRLDASFERLIDHLTLAFSARSETHDS